MPISRCFSALPTPLKWRRAATNRTLCVQISSLLLHHVDAISLIRSKGSLLPRPLTSSVLRRILTLTRSNPDISLRFFLFARSHLSFCPALPDISAITSILVDAGNLSPAAHLLYPVLRSHPAPVVLDALLSSSSNTSQSNLLSLALELYSAIPSLPNALETFSRIRASWLTPSSRCCNALLDLLCSRGKIHTAWLVCASALRIGFQINGRGWGVLIRLLCQEGKIQRAEMLLNLGFCHRSSSYDFVVHCYAARREYGAVIQMLNGIEKEHFIPRLSTLSSILNWSCKFGDVKIAGLIMKEIVVRDFLPMVPAMDFDWVIRRFCELGKTFAALLIFGKAQNRNIVLESYSFNCLLRALAQEGRAKEALKLYNSMSQSGVSVDPGSLDVFMSGICRGQGQPAEELDAVIKNVIRDGFLPNVSDLSRYIAKTCSRGRWKEVMELIDVVLNKGILVDASCCCLLVKHLCNNGHVDLAISLHERMRCLGGCLDVCSYNTLLEALVVDGRTTEASEIFDYMREKNVFSDYSFVIIITALVHVKELRKAMDIHDQMMKLGLRPDMETYKCLISGFSLGRTCS